MNIDIEPLQNAVTFMQACVTMTEPTDGSEPVPKSDSDWFIHNLACAVSCEIDKIQRAKEAEVLAALKESRKVLAVAIRANWEGATDDDIAGHITIKRLDGAIAALKAS